jgi:hypothetical protein
MAERVHRTLQNPLDRPWSSAGDLQMKLRSVARTGTIWWRHDRHEICLWFVADGELIASPNGVAVGKDDFQ